MDVETDPHWKLYFRALDIIEGRSNGHALPIIRKLARRRFPPAINVLSDYLSEAEAIRILRKAARRGDPNSAYNLAIMHRNRGDMLNYRMAMRWAAKDDPDAATDLRRFKTRFPHEVMRRFRRIAPSRD
jgi:TPR repeat protein